VSQDQEGVIRGLKEQVDDLRVAEATGLETASALTAAKAQLGTVVSMKDELARAHYAMDNMRKELDRCDVYTTRHDVMANCVPAVSPGWVRCQQQKSWPTEVNVGVR
jgi:hypothetical protein